MGQGQLCRSGESIVLSESTGYIASVVTEDTQLGSTLCPWLIQGQSGQQVGCSALVIYFQEEWKL